MKPHDAVALTLVGWYLMLPPWVAKGRFDASAPLSKWKISGRFNTGEQCKLVQKAVVDWYIDHPNDKQASWFRSLYGASRCVSANDPRLKRILGHPAS